MILYLVTADDYEYQDLKLITVDLQRAVDYAIKIAKEQEQDIECGVSVYEVDAAYEPCRKERIVNVNIRTRSININKEYKERLFFWDNVQWVDDEL